MLTDHEKVYLGIRPPSTTQNPNDKIGLQFADPGHPLMRAFDDAVRQATKGKGERHGGDKTPFFEQPWYATAKRTGVGGLMFQAIKKAGEACDKDDIEAFHRELLGAMVYLGMAYLYTQIHGFKKEGRK